MTPAERMTKILLVEEIRRAYIEATNQRPQADDSDEADEADAEEDENEE